jgi:hypothetical protein
MRIFILLFIISFNAWAVDTIGPKCSLTWDHVTDPRVTGYKMYVDNVVTVSLPKTQNVIECSLAKVPSGKNTTVAVTAFSPQAESAKSNVLSFYWSTAVLSTPLNLRLQ